MTSKPALEQLNRLVGTWATDANGDRIDRCRFGSVIDEECHAATLIVAKI